jgi:hypothetical protein
MPMATMIIVMPGLGLIAAETLNAGAELLIVRLETAFSVQPTRIAASARSAAAEHASSRRVPRILRANVRLRWEHVLPILAMARAPVNIFPASRLDATAPVRVVLARRSLVRTWLPGLILTAIVRVTATSATARVLAGRITPSVRIPWRRAIVRDLARLIIARLVLTPMVPAGILPAAAIPAAIRLTLWGLIAAGCVSLVMVLVLV